ncbi:MAG: CRTAC1 family protein [Pseudomonadota bacterium]
MFEDISDRSEFSEYQGMTYGVAWGDYDGDGKPDLYVTNHLGTAMLFRNEGEGVFVDVTADVFDPEALSGDKHGAAWADFNNDGQQDLVQLTGAIMGAGIESKRLFINEDAKLLERAAELGVDNPAGRTRMPLWLDLNKDGKLDLFHGAEARFDNLTPPFWYRQIAHGFSDASWMFDPRSRSMPFCILAPLNGDRHPEIVCRSQGKGGTVRVFDVAELPASLLEILPTSAFEDLVAGDFDRDGRFDLLMARKYPGSRLAWARGGDDTLTAQVELRPENAEDTTGIRFQSSGTLSFTVSGQHAGELKPVNVLLGKAGINPEAMQFEIPADAVIGSALDQAKPEVAVVLNSDRPGVWQIDFYASEVSFGGKNKPRYINVRVESSESIRNVVALAESAREENAPQRLFMNRNGQMVEESDSRGINAFPISAVNVVAGDFDNDMDLDIFLLGSSDAGNTPNLLLLNDGSGEFTAVENAGGASGLLVGVGDSATTADVDLDGFLDILTAGGGSMGRSLGLPSDNGQYQLFRNLGNENNWIMIDLIGTQSNRDGVGAIVSVVAGKKTQIRLQDGGIHYRGQNHSRLHFGLGDNNHIDELIVEWPSGVNQKYGQFDANQILQIREPELIEPGETL